MYPFYGGVCLTGILLIEIMAQGNKIRYARTSESVYHREQVSFLMKCQPKEVLLHFLLALHFLLRTRCWSIYEVYDFQNIECYHESSIMNLF